MSFTVETTKIPDVLLIKPQVFGDRRGFFMESYHAERYQESGINVRFVQDNFSRSCSRTLRGLHYQLPHTQAKLVSVLQGEVFDVAVDIRAGSPTFGQWVGVVLSDENHQQLYIPEGLAHGFCVLSESVDFFYKCNDYYAPADDHGVLWSDPAIGIEWPISDPILSKKDVTHPVLADIPRKVLPVFKGYGARQ